MLSFFGRGSAFSDAHNSAFFRYGDDLILVDCPMNAFMQVKRMDLAGIGNIYILMTHTHSDHAGGVALLIDYEFFIGHIPVTVVAPNSRVEENLRYYLTNLEGCEDHWYKLTSAEKISFPWLIRAIPTVHAPQLQGKCFGYLFSKDGIKAAYTGDSTDPSPFVSELGSGDILYMEVSSYRSEVHINIDDVLGLIKELTDKGIRVYLMHMDDEEAILARAEGTGAEPAPLYQGGNIMDNNLGQILDITDNLYRQMCSNTESDHNTLFKNLTELGKTLVGSDRASFWKWDKRRHELWTTAATGVDRIVIPDNTGLVGKAITNKTVVVTNDPYNDPDFNSSVDKKTGYITKSVMVLPVADVNGEFIGAFQLINKNGDKGFDAVEDSRKLSLPALICGLALESDTFLDDAHHDRLTKLKNRIGFYHDFSKKYMKYLEDDCDKPLSMFICDIDKFKLVNDTYGHNAGDQVLEHAAKLLMESCEEGENAYRWGGEEFIILMPDTTLEQATEKAEKLRLTIEAADFPADGITIKKTMSFGVSQFVKGKSIEDNVSIADGRLYTAKETGRNKVVSCDS